MSLSERLQWLLLGCLIGLVLGYVARDIRYRMLAKKSKEDRMARQKNERGFMDSAYLANIMLLIVVVLTAAAAIQSQRASNKVEHTQHRVEKVTSCNRMFLTQTLAALNERTTYAQAQSKANVELQKAQSAFLSVLLIKPAPTAELYSSALQKYFNALTKFVTLSGKTADKVAKNPYPTDEALDSCLDASLND